LRKAIHQEAQRAQGHKGKCMSFFVSMVSFVVG
jgi:hypothetical protein